jgi:phospholipid/cholesterol/gamma-HCH transport system ATP-binding protein
VVSEASTTEVTEVTGPLALELRGVTKRFGDRTVLDDVSLAVPRGETTVLLGPSGTGKSTLIRLAVGLDRPDSGQVIALGEDVGTLSERDLLVLRRRFGMLFQEGALFGSLSVFDNIAFPLRQHIKPTEASLRDRIFELLAMVGLEGLGDRLPAQLSGGQKKRVALARAIALEPEMVFFDEPTSGLDPQTSASIDALINDMQARLAITFVVITHDVLSAREIGAHVGMLFEGKLRAFGPCEEVFETEDDLVRRFLDREPPAPVDGGFLSGPGSIR